jgi:cytochrome d ubiquinol oxidase subunit I
MNFYPYFILLPYLANTTGWIMTEVGRVPWVVFGLMRLEEAVSPTVPSGLVLTSLIGFTLVYGGLMVADIYLLTKFAKAGVPDEKDRSPILPDDNLSFVGAQD